MVYVFPYHAHLLFYLHFARAELSYTQKPIGVHFEPKMGLSYPSSEGFLMISMHTKCVWKYNSSVPTSKF